MQLDFVGFLDGLFSADGGVSETRVIPPLTPNDLPADWHFLWDERAAIMEYDGGLPREHAEAAALADIIEIMTKAGIELR